VSDIATVTFYKESTRDMPVFYGSMVYVIEVRKCLLSFGAESFVFKVAIQKFKDQDI